MVQPLPPMSSSYSWQKVSYKRKKNIEIATNSSTNNEVNNTALSTYSIKEYVPKLKEQKDIISKAKNTTVREKHKTALDFEYCIKKEKSQYQKHTRRRRFHLLEIKQIKRAHRHLLTSIESVNKNRVNVEKSKKVATSFTVSGKCHESKRNCKKQIKTTSPAAAAATRAAAAPSQSKSELQYISSTNGRQRKTNLTNKQQKNKR